MLTLKNKIFISLLSLLFLTACEKQIKIDLPYEGDKLVLNALIMNDSLVYARITSSSEIRNIINYPTPPGAKADLYENDLLKETLSIKNIGGTDYFVSTLRAQQGKKYTIKVTATGLAAAEGSAIIPGVANFIPADFRLVNNNNSSQAKVTIKITDAPGVKNYYRLRLYDADTNRVATGPRYLINKNFQFYFRVDNLVSNTAFDILSDNSYGQVVFSDDKFDGKEVSLTVNIESYFNSGTDDYLATELTSLSEDAYRYIQSRNNQLDNDGNPFVEPVVVYNNIKGGYGIAGGMAMGMRVIKQQ
jgi:Domain of unknown function (DUF4249)